MKARIVRLGIKRWWRNAAWLHMTAMILLGIVFAVGIILVAASLLAPIINFLNAIK